jgi:hypothetical protein
LAGFRTAVGENGHEDQGVAFDDENADENGDGECREHAPPHLVPARRTRRYEVLI